MSWQPISTAPKDGTVVLLYGRYLIDGPKIRVPGYYNGGWNYNKDAWHVEDTAHDINSIMPTHWQPLDAPPNQDT